MASIVSWLCCVKVCRLRVQRLAPVALGSARRGPYPPVSSPALVSAVSFHSLSLLCASLPLDSRLCCTHNRLTQQVLWTSPACPPSDVFYSRLLCRPPSPCFLSLQEADVVQRRASIVKELLQGLIRLLLCRGACMHCEMGRHAHVRGARPASGAAIHTCWSTHARTLSSRFLPPLFGYPTLPSPHRQT